MARRRASVDDSDQLALWSVQVYRNFTEWSFDTYLWQTVERTAKYINQLMRGRLELLSTRGPAQLLSTGFGTAGCTVLACSVPLGSGIQPATDLSRKETRDGCSHHCSFW